MVPPLTRDSSLISLKTWQLFVLALPDDPPKTHKHSDIRLIAHLDPYITAANSDSFAWLSVLCIEDTGLSEDEWFKLGDMRNLVFLHTRGGRLSPRGSINEIVIRGWNRMASNGAFSRLHALFLQEQYQVTTQCLRHVNAFAALAHVGLLNCGREPPSNESLQGTGWTESSK